MTLSVIPLALLAERRRDLLGPDECERTSLKTDVF